MKDHKTWVGAWPTAPFWSTDGDTAFFFWNPQGAFDGDSLFGVLGQGGEPQQLSPAARRAPRTTFDRWHHGYGNYSEDFTQKVFVHEGDLFLYSLADDVTTRLTQMFGQHSDPHFAAGDSAIFFTIENNVYRLDVASGRVRPLTDLRPGEDLEADPELDPQDRFLKYQQKSLFEVLSRRHRERERAEKAQKIEREARTDPPVYHYGEGSISNLQIDPVGRFVSFVLVQPGGDSKPTTVHNYVTETGYAEEIPARPKVGSPTSDFELHIQDLERDTVMVINLHQIEGAYDLPPYILEQGVEMDSSEAKRRLIPHGPVWSRDGRFAVVVIVAADNKDRWIARLHPESGQLTVLDRQHDEAWIGGPGIDGRWSAGAVGWLPDNRRLYFQSEETGFSHLYTVDVQTGSVTQLTDGEFEIFDPQISRDGRFWYVSSSEDSPFERHFYRMPIDGGTRTRLTTMAGRNDVALSPDERTMAILHSFSNRPPEVFIQPVSPDGPPQRITFSQTDEWLEYPWRQPEIVRFEASDGVAVPANLYVPDRPNGAAVLFVHGAGYLQNVHRGWSQYFREYMFHNLLADLGYVILDVDYRASAGYGRDWRTAIYRHMGGRDLQDYVDASKYITETFDIPPERIGIYGGSYGGFITLMALFTESDYFAAGAALRSVTDWAHYNHGYTSNILNSPATDSLAFARSSPINFAEGLRDPLLITHGIVDVNVQFQDVARLAQRLIELKKENWEVAIYPVEDHAFIEPESWHDQYRRILKLFEDNLHPEPSDDRTIGG